MREMTNVFVCVSLQEVEYVKEEAKMVYLLECLQKTAPPVSTFTCYDAQYIQRKNICTSPMFKYCLFILTGAYIC